MQTVAGDDQSEVVIQRVARASGNPTTNTGIGQCGDWLRPSSGRRDRVNLVHGGVLKIVQRSVLYQKYRIGGPSGER